MPYRAAGDGSADSRAFNVFGYSFNLDRSKVARSINLPANEHFLVLAMTLVP